MAIAQTGSRPDAEALQKYERGIQARSIDVEPTEAWHACDDAAVNVDFWQAGIPTEELKAQAVHQQAGAREGEDLIIISANTSTGIVYCMLDLSYEVLLYKFQGQEIINRM